MKTCVALRVPCYSYLQSTPPAAKAPSLLGLVWKRQGLQGRPQCQKHEKVKINKNGQKAKQIRPKKLASPEQSDPVIGAM